MYAKVGRLSAATGINALVSDGDGHLVVTAAGARYADLVDSGRVFGVANQALVTTTEALLTTWTGLGVANPTASGVDLVMLEFGCSMDAAGAASSVGLMVASNLNFGAGIVIRNQKIGCVMGTHALADVDVDPIGTPILYRVYGSVGSVATTGYALQRGLVVDLAGSLVIEPGSSVLTYTSIVTAGLCFHFVWAEIER